MKGALNSESPLPAYLCPCMAESRPTPPTPVKQVRCAALRCAVLCSVALSSAVLCCAVLCCAVLCCEEHTCHVLLDSPPNQLCAAGCDAFLTDS